MKIAQIRYEAIDTLPYLTPLLYLFNSDYGMPIAFFCPFLCKNVYLFFCIFFHIFVHKKCFMQQNRNYPLSRKSLFILYPQQKADYFSHLKTCLLFIHTPREDIHRVIHRMYITFLFCGFIDVSQPIFGKRRAVLHKFSTDYATLF